MNPENCWITAVPVVPLVLLAGPHQLIDIQIVFDGLTKRSRFLGPLKPPSILNLYDGNHLEVRQGWQELDGTFSIEQSHKGLSTQVYTCLDFYTTVI